MASVSGEKMTKMLTDIEIAKKEVARQKKARENNFQEFRETQDFKTRKKSDVLERLKKNKYV